MRDKIFICRRCQSRVKGKTPECEIGFEWTDESFKEFKKEMEGLKKFREDGSKLVLTSCLGICPTERITYQELVNGKMDLERSYPVEDTKDKVFKRFAK